MGAIKAIQASSVVMKNDGLIIERLSRIPTDSRPLVLVSFDSSGENSHIEPITFHIGFFAPIIDLVTVRNIPPYHRQPYDKPKSLAVFTQVYNETEFLPIWEKHYKALVPMSDLYVIDHGSTLNIRDCLGPDTNIIRIPRGETDAQNIVQFCGHFQRFLLTQYNWVMHVDCDELIVHSGGNDRFRERLNDPTYGPIIRADKQGDVIDHTNGVSPLINDIPISRQRHLMGQNRALRKPILSRIPTTWTMGFHDVLELEVRDDPEIWLIHLQYADFQLHARRARNVHYNMTLSESDQRYTNMDSKSTSVSELQGKVDGYFPTRDRVTLPEWMEGAF